MYKLLIIAVLISSSLTSIFSQDTTYFDSKWKESNKVSAYYYRVDSKEGDLFKRIDYYSKGNQIQMNGTYTSLNPEMKSGHFTYYHQNGKLKHVGDYFDNKEIGEHIWYYENGQMEAVENYINGVFSGKYIEYYETGKVSSESMFLTGKQNGKTKYFREDGSLHSEGAFKKGERNGVWKYYDEKGELLGTNEFKTEYIIKEADLFIEMPNTDWRLDSYTAGDMSQYIFKRKVITDKDGNDIIPAIMIYIEDASNYEDLTVYSIMKQRPFIEKGIEIDEILIHENLNYPISYINSYWYKCHYDDGTFDHIFYMVHILDEKKRGIQIYMDMTKAVAEDYEEEFMSTLRSIKVND